MPILVLLNALITHCKRPCWSNCTTCVAKTKTTTEVPSCCLKMSTVLENSTQETDVILANTKHCNGTTDDEETACYFIKNLSMSSDIIGITKEKCTTDSNSEGVETTAKCFVQFVEERTTIYWHVYCSY
jgi:hypothetical protein